VLPAVVFAATRAWLLLIPFGLIPYLGGTLVINDVTLYEQWARTLQTGSFPIGDQMWQYPPLVGPVLALGAAIPPDPTLGLVLVMLTADVATFVVLMRAVSRGADVTGAWAWIAAGMLIGPVWLTRFDVLPALFAVLGLLAMSKPVRSGVWLGMGALLKVWPVLLLLAVPRRSLPKALVGFVVSSAVILVTLLLTMDGAGAFASQQRARGLQVESVPAWLFLLGHHFGWNRFFIYRYGAMEVQAQGTELVALVVTVVAVLALGALALLRFIGRLDHALPADIALVVVLVSMVTSRVLSPQYLIWVAAIAAVCLLSPRTRMRPVIMLLLPVAALGQILYPMHYNWLLSDGWSGLAIQTGRVLLLLAAAVWGAQRLLQRADGVDDVGVETVEQVSQTA
jgi:hypothetical protein